MDKLLHLFRKIALAAPLLLGCLVLLLLARPDSGSTITESLPVAGPQHTSAASPAALSQQASEKPADKSVLDAEVLNSPFSFFEDAFAGEEGSAEDTPAADPVILTFKALVATLLSTIM